ncbi:MAG: hypothetical protein ACPGUZ_02425 [Holosporaceae bacterium]
MTAIGLDKDLFRQITSASVRHTFFFKGCFVPDYTGRPLKDNAPQTGP